MFFGIEPFYCVIYRLQGFIDHDFSASDEGEVEENWGIVSFGTPCSYDLGPTATRRRTDGMTSLGSRKFYLEAEYDIRDGDRLSTNNCFYKVVDVEPIYDLRRDIHHYECQIEVIDWNIPDTLTQWVSGEGVGNERLIEVDFDYQSTSPINITSVITGETVVKVGVLVETAFDNSATLSIGDSTDHSLLMATTDNLLYRINYYEVMCYYECLVDKEFSIYLDVGDSEQGSGRVFIEISQESQDTEEQVVPDEGFGYFPEG